jgi:predicted RNA methylase
LSKRQITKHTKGLKRDIIDKFYTKNDVVDICIQIIRDNVEFNNNDAIIEPSSGNGSFIDGIKSLSKNYIFYDLQPEHDEITQQDYLLFNPQEIKSKYENIHVIGNPPFGRQSSLAIKFIKKSCEFADSVSFILPKSFKKDSLKNKIPSKFHLIFEYDLPSYSFLVNEVEYDVPCVFQIWKKMTNNRPVVEKLEPLHFIFVNKSNEPDISFRRVGVNAGVIDKNVEEKSIQSHYFIKFTNGKSIDENILLLSHMIFDFNNTVGPKSISRQELIYKFNLHLEI